MAGSLTINSNSPYSRQFLELLPSLQIPSIYYKDAVMLEINSRDYPSRCHGTNINTRELVQHLNKCPHIQKIFYPTDWKFIDSSSSQHQQMSSQGYQNYTKLLRRDSQLSNELVQLGFVAGYGCLFSLVFDKLFPVEVSRYF
jgi:cystathionine beta-lyase/cystathionine gamma-synthase